MVIVSGCSWLDYPAAPIGQASPASPDFNFLKRASPINYFEFVVAPVQIHSGTADTMTPPYWAEDIYQALQAAGKDVEYFTYPGEGHAFDGESWQLFMGRASGFFDRYVK